MKLIIQVPAYNEAKNLPATLAALPRTVAGFDTVEVLVVDDGSTDGTATAARAAGAHHVVRHIHNRGLARAFETGLQAALERSADVIVNTDADNQYCADDVHVLVEPILSGKADMVVGERPIPGIAHFSRGKKVLQRLGSAVVRFVSGTDVRDAPSGFRAFSRSAAQSLRVFSSYTYTLETIIQAGQKHLAVMSVPIRVNHPTRESRLIKSIPRYVLRSVETMFRIFVTYRPLRFFAVLAASAALPGVVICSRFVILFAMGEGEGKIQSLILGSLLIGIGFLLAVVGLLADLIAVNRQLLERNNMELKALTDRLSRTQSFPVESTTP